MIYVRKPSWRVLKCHRSYTVDEAARALLVSKGTIRRWFKHGLSALTDKRPSLILGADLITFLQKRAIPKQKCALDECYCFSCRKPRRPRSSEMEYQRFNPKGGNLRATCGVCFTTMHKRISEENLEHLEKTIAISMAVEDASSGQEKPPLVSYVKPSPNDHLKQRA